MLHGRSPFVVLALGGLLAACSSDNGPPSPYGQTAGATPVGLAPQSMVLRPAQLPGYVRSNDVAVGPDTIAEMDNDPSLQATLTGEGLLTGARDTYADPNRGGPPTPFETVISQVLVFRDALGATSFFGDEQKRRTTAPTGGTLTTLNGLPLGGADAIIGVAATVPASAAGQPPARALFALIRRGRVVAELLGGGSQQSATDGRFTALVSVQEEQLTS